MINKGYDINAIKEVLDEVIHDYIIPAGLDEWEEPHLFDEDLFNYEETLLVEQMEHDLIRMEQGYDEKEEYWEIH